MSETRDWRRYVRAHLPTLTVSAERETEIVEELALQAEQTCAAARAEGAAEDAAMAAVEAAFPDWRELADEIARSERPVAAAVPARLTPDIESLPERVPVVGALVRAVWQDARYASRLLRRNPGFAAVAVLTLALGIGVNTATFSIVNGVVLRPLPYERPDALIRIFCTWTDFPKGAVSVPEYIDFDETARSLDGLGAYSVGEVDMTVGDVPLGLRRSSVSASLFPLLGVEPAIGRGFRDEESRPGGERVVLLSHGLWERAFSGQPQVVGTSVRMAGEPFQIIGVMPRGFAFPETSIDVWLPLRWARSAWCC